MMIDKCPKCGSERITKYSLYAKKSPGCLIGCAALVLVIFFLVWLIVGAMTDPSQLIFFLVIISIILIVGLIHRSKLFICEKCGHKFKDSI